jgi:hypothetical protein
VDEEEFVVDETRTPGVFERRSIPTGSFFCGIAPGPATPTRNNGRLEFPRGPTGGCFDAPTNPLVHNQVTAIYVEPVDALGRRNVERRVTADFTHPAIP